MSKKHVDDYYKQICNDYLEMLDNLKDMEKEAEQGLVSPDKLEQMKASLEPLKNNYMRISYIMYLFNKPERKEKHARYEKQNAKLLKNIKMDKTEHEENREVLDKMTF